MAVSSQSGAPLGTRFWKKGLPCDTIDPALHDRGALAQVTHDGLLALDVVGDEVQLGEARLGEEELVGFGDAQLPAGDLDHDVFAILLALAALRRIVHLLAWHT